MGKKSKKSVKPADTFVDLPIVEDVQQDTPRHPLMARLANVRVSLVVFSVGGVIAFLLGGWAFGPYIGGGVQLSSASQTCKTVKGHEVCVPRESEDGAALVKVTSDGWARYADGSKWNGSDWQ